MHYAQVDGLGNLGNFHVDMSENRMPFPSQDESRMHRFRSKYIAALFFLQIKHMQTHGPVAEYQK